MAEFDADLYEFLKENEICMWEENGQLKFGVHVWFSDIKDFIEIAGYHILDDGGIETQLNNDTTLFIPLEDIFQNCNYLIEHYKHCFNEEDLKKYKEAIIQFERDAH